MFILVELLHKKKKEATELSELLNDLKKQIDQVSQYKPHPLQTAPPVTLPVLQVQLHLTSHREKQAGEGLMGHTDTGVEIIDEDEFKAVTQLKQVATPFKTALPEHPYNLVVSV